MLAFSLCARYTRWTWHFPTWVSPVQMCLCHQPQQRWVPAHVQGLCRSAPWKNLQPLAGQVAPAKQDHLKHCITASPWKTVGLERLVADRAQHLLGGRDTVLIADDPCLTKFGLPSLAASRQCCGQAGKVTSCQWRGSVTLARREILTSP